MYNIPEFLFFGAVMEQSKGSEGKSGSWKIETSQENFILSQTDKLRIGGSNEVCLSAVLLSASFRKDLNFLEGKVEDNKEPMPGDEPDESNQQFNKEVGSEGIDLEKVEGENQKSRTKVSKFL